jgi:hypothetical protein
MLAAIRSFMFCKKAVLPILSMGIFSFAVHLSILNARSQSIFDGRTDLRYQKIIFERAESIAQKAFNQLL